MKTKTKLIGLVAAGLLCAGSLGAPAPTAASEPSLQDRAHVMDICEIMTDIAACRQVNAVSERLRGAAGETCEAGGRTLRHNVTSLELLLAAQIGQKDNLTASDVAQFVRLVCN